MFGSFKDSAAKVAANRHPLVQRFGTVHSIHIDTEARSIQIQLGLKSEATPIGVTVRYTVLSEESCTRIQVDSVAVSREWMHEAAQIWLASKGPLIIPIDGLAGQLVRFLL